MSAAIEVIFFDLGDTLVGGEPLQLMPGAKDALAQLHAKGVRLGIISNTGQLTLDDLKAQIPVSFPWAEFEPGLIVLSSEVGVEKPAPGIFEAAISKAGIVAAKCLYCSESLLETFAAQRVGLRAARLQEPPQSDASALLPGLVGSGLLD